MNKRGFEINEQAGTYSFPLVRDAAAAFVCDGVTHSVRDMQTCDMLDSTLDKTFGEGLTLHWRLRSPGVHGLQFGLELTAYAARPWWTIRAWVENKSRKPVSLQRFVLLRAPLGNLRLGGHWKQWRVLSDDCGRLGDVVNGIADKDSAIRARVAMGLANPKGDGAAVIGFSAREAYGEIRIVRQGTGACLELSCEMDDVLVPPGTVRWSEAVHVGQLPVLRGLEEFAEATGREVNARTDGPSFTGWCSWYSFNPFWDTDVTEDRVLDYARAAEQFRSDIPLQLMLLDDGYQTLPGDWTSLRPLFPHGMKWLTDRVKEKGLIPGLWVGAPLVHADSELFRQHPDWVVRNPDGSFHVNDRNWGGLTHSLDITKPAVLDHLRELFRTISEDWGFQYIKLDFNHTPGVPTRHDRSVTSLQALRRMYEVIREAVGPDVFIANCSGSLFPAVLGIAQAGRTSGDVLPNWNSVLDGCRKNILRTPFHRRWWVNDPDCVMLRTEPQSTLTLCELQTHLTANLLCGGLVLFADDLAKLPPERRRLLAQAMPPWGESAAILDLMTAPEPGIPRVLSLPIRRPWESYAIVGAFNWADKPADLTIPFAELGLDGRQPHHVFEFWSDTYHGAMTGSCRLRRQAPHSCQLLAIRPVVPDEIRVVSTDLHLLQGALEITHEDRRNTSPFNQAKAELTLALKAVSVREGKVILAAGDGLRLAACQGALSELRRRPDGLWEISLTRMADEVALLLRLREG